MESKAWIPMMKPTSISTWKLKARGAGGKPMVFCVFLLGTWKTKHRDFQLQVFKGPLDCCF